MADLYIGLMSGTSMDGIDAVLVRFDTRSLEILGTLAHPYPTELSKTLASCIRDPAGCSVDSVGTLGVEIGRCFRDAANSLLEQAGVDAALVTAIGSHGQTLRHQPGGAAPFTLQLGDPAIIATGTGIATVADFRSADLALGGQGAPLAPVFHDWLFRQPGATRAVVNIGGIANVTILPADDSPACGFDTGPGNTLMDGWVQRHRGEAFDRDGAWAAAGTVNAGLLRRLLDDPYFITAPPKSTGREYFHLDWLEAAGIDGIDPADVQATLCALSATSIANAIRTSAGEHSEVFVCGGGAANPELMRQIERLLPGCPLASTAMLGLEPEWVEATAFAWLAQRRLQELPGNLPAVTGATRATTLGAVYLPH